MTDKIRNRSTVDFLAEADLIMFYLESPESEVLSWPEFFDAWTKEDRKGAKPR